MSDHAFVLPGIDGPVAVARLSGGECCPPTICNIDLCALACSFVHDLPSGPLWDRAKAAAIQKIECGGEPVDDPLCSGIVTHAVYSAERLYKLLLDGVWPQLREANPATAYATLDDWLDRLGWEDCFKCACGCVDMDAGENRPPYELLMPDGRRICCPDEAPNGLTMAVKRGVILALWRLRLGVVPNIANINFIVSSLGAELVADHDGEDNCCRPRFLIRAKSDFLPCVWPVECPRPEDLTGAEAIPCLAYWTLECDGEGDGRRIYPGVLAAECIIRSILSDRFVSIVRT